MLMLMLMVTVAITAAGRRHAVVRPYYRSSTSVLPALGVRKQAIVQEEHTDAPTRALRLARRDHCPCLGRLIRFWRPETQKLAELLCKVDFGGRINAMALRQLIMS